MPLSETPRSSPSTGTTVGGAVLAAGAILAGMALSRHPRLALMVGAAALMGWRMVSNGLAAPRRPVIKEDGSIVLDESYDAVSEGGEEDAGADEAAHRSSLFFAETVDEGEDAAPVVGGTTVWFALHEVGVEKELSPESLLLETEEGGDSQLASQDMAALIKALHPPDSPEATPPSASDLLADDLDRQTPAPGSS